MNSMQAVEVNKTSRLEKRTIAILSLAPWGFLAFIPIAGKIDEVLGNEGKMCGVLAGFALGCTFLACCICAPASVILCFLARDLATARKAFWILTAIVPAAFGIYVLLDGFGIIPRPDPHIHHRHQPTTLPTT
jgi:uncharacterized membrane protein YraQ (UPF0718 family)